MMFKVDVYGVRHWVADVTEVQDVYHFEAAIGAHEGTVCGLAYDVTQPGATEWLHRQVNPQDGGRKVRTIIPGGVVSEGLTNFVLIRIHCDRKGEGPELQFERVQDWIVPKGCSYLMERGETIDRI